MMETLRNEIRALIAPIIEVDPEKIRPQTHFVRELGADSMSALEIMATLERKYSIILRPEHLPQLATLDQIAGLVNSLAHK